MGQVLYTATAPDGQELNGYIEVKTNREALDILGARGFSNIQLHSEAMTSGQRDYLEGLSERDQELLARLEASVLRDPSFANFLKEVLRANRWSLLLGMGLAAWGYSGDTWYLLYGGLFVALIMPLLSILSYRTSITYDQVLKTFATGDWDQMVACIDQLRGKLGGPEAEFDLDLKQAAAKVADGRLEEALADLEIWRYAFDSDAPGMYQSRVASLFFAAGKHETCLEEMRAALKASPDNFMMSLDLALMEAKIGDPNTAETLLDSIDIAEVPAYGLPFLDWITGLVEWRRGEECGTPMLASAVQGFTQYIDMPAVWPSLAVCTADYALALAKAGQTDMAEEMLTPVWPIVRTHGGKALVSDLQGLCKELS